MNKARRIWQSYGGWIVLSLPVAMVIIMIAVDYATANILPVTAAAAPIESEITFDMERNTAYTAEDGWVLITSAEVIRSLPLTENLTGGTSPPVCPPALRGGLEATVKTMYTIPEEAELSDGSIGLLSIPRLKLSVGVFETEDELEAMESGIAHFKTTSAWSGNIGLCGHNQNFDLTDSIYHLQRGADSENKNIGFGACRTLCCEHECMQLRRLCRYNGTGGKNRTA